MGAQFCLKSVVAGGRGILSREYDSFVAIHAAKPWRRAVCARSHTGRQEVGKDLRKTGIGGCADKRICVNALEEITCVVSCVPDFKREGLGQLTLHAEAPTLHLVWPEVLWNHGLAEVTWIQLAQ